VVVSWRSNVPTVGTLVVYPVTEPNNVQTFQSSESLAHAVVVPNLSRETTYEWYIVSNSLCGETTSGTRQFTVGKGVVFQNRQVSVSINRDYEQLVQVWVVNQDSVPHDLQVEIQESYEDLIVDFRGIGSIDEPLTLLPGESRSVELAIHAQDAMVPTYTLNAVLTSSDWKR
jgi:hypothetical protein